MNEWQRAFEDVEQSVQHDANDFGYTDNMEDAVRAKYAKDLLAYIKQIKPRPKEPKPTMDELRDKFLGQEDDHA